MLALTKKGMKREDAYAAVQKHAMDSWQSKKSFKELLQSDSTISSYMKKNDWDELFDLKKSLKNVDYIFERVGLH